MREPDGHALVHSSCLLTSVFRHLTTDSRDAANMDKSVHAPKCCPPASDYCLLDKIGSLNPFGVYLTNRFDVIQAGDTFDFVV